MKIKLVGMVPKDLVICISEHYPDATEHNATWVIKHPQYLSFIIKPEDLRFLGAQKDYLASKRKFETVHFVFDSKMPEAQFEVHVTFPHMEWLEKKRRSQLKILKDVTG